MLITAWSTLGLALSLDMLTSSVSNCVLERANRMVHSGSSSVSDCVLGRANCMVLKTSPCRNQLENDAGWAAKGHAFTNGVVVVVSLSCQHSVRNPPLRFVGNGW